MAKSQDQWFASLKTWVPEWFLSDGVYNEAVFQALAATLAAAQSDLEDSVAQTYIQSAVSTFLDLHGSERGVTRLPGELDAQFAIRIRSKSLISQADIPDLTSILNKLLIKGRVTIREDYQGNPFIGRDTFLNRGALVVTPVRNTFSIMVDQQLHDPYSFLDRGIFISRGDPVGTLDSSAYVFQLIQAAVDDNKAFGTLYRIVERLA